MVIKNVLILGAGSLGAIEHFYKDGFEKCGIVVYTYIIADQYYAAINKSIFHKVANKISADIFYKSINDKLKAFMAQRKFDIILVFKGMELFPETVMQLKEHAQILANYNADHPFTFYFPGSGNKNVRNSIIHYDVHFSYSGGIVDQLRSKFKVRAYCIPFGYNSNIKAASLTGDFNKYKSKFLFIGAYDIERAVYLNRLQNDSLDIYGDSKWRTRSFLRPHLKSAYKNKPLYGSEYVDAIPKAIGILNLLRKQNLNENSHNMRTFEVPGYGGVLISQRTSEQLDFFDDGKEAIFFESVDELKDRFAYLLRKPSVVESIKKAAISRSIRSGYSYNSRSQQLLKCLEANF